MYSAFQAPHLPLSYAEARRQDLVAEAERDRLSSLAIAARGSRRSAIVGMMRAVRMQLGAILVRAGECLQGTELANPVDACPPVGTLRGAR